MNHPNALAAKVAAVNRANAEANRLFPIIAAALLPFLGQKVTKADGTLTEKVRKVLTPLYPVAERLQVFPDLSGGYSFRLTVKTWESYGAPGETFGCACYHETSLYFGKLRGGVLEEWNGAPYEPRRTDYTTAEVAALRAAAESAREIARNAESACAPFGLYDR